MLETHIAFYPRNLGKYYNEVMSRAKDWVLFIDHDIYLCCQYWHSICEKAIEKLGHQAGWISAVTNRIACTVQKVNVNDTDDLNYHCDIAYQMWNQHKYETYEILNAGMFSGFFILTHKEAWEKSGGFIQKEDLKRTIDNDYCDKILKAGYKRYILPGLYVYHRYTHKKRWQ